MNVSGNRKTPILDAQARKIRREFTREPVKTSVAERGGNGISNGTMDHQKETSSVFSNVIGKKKMIHSLE